MSVSFRRLTDNYAEKTNPRSKYNLLHHVMIFSKKDNCSIKSRIQYPELKEIK